MPRPMEAPQSHLLFPRQAKIQLSRASCCRGPRFPEAKFPPRSLVKCPSSDRPQPTAWAAWEGRQSPGLQSPSGELAAALAFHSLLSSKDKADKVNRHEYCCAFHTSKALAPQHPSWVSKCSYCKNRMGLLSFSRFASKVLQLRLLVVCSSGRAVGLP